MSWKITKLVTVLNASQWKWPSRVSITSASFFSKEIDLWRQWISGLSISGLHPVRPRACWVPPAGVLRWREGQDWWDWQSFPWKRPGVFFCFFALRCKDICYKKSNFRCFIRSSAGQHILYLLYPPIMILNPHKADSLVQSVIDALRQINTDPARTPTALAVSFCVCLFHYIFISTYTYITLTALAVSWCVFVTFCI